MTDDRSVRRDQILVSVMTVTNSWSWRSSLTIGRFCPLPKVMPTIQIHNIYNCICTCSMCGLSLVKNQLRMCVIFTFLRYTKYMITILSLYTCMQYNIKLLPVQALYNICCTKPELTKALYYIYLYICCNDSLLTWRVVSLTAAQFKPPIFSVPTSHFWARNRL
jgi:hypothetical protein